MTVQLMTGDNLQVSFVFCEAIGLKWHWVWGVILESELGYKIHKRKQIIRHHHLCWATAMLLL